jgi:PQQ-like domain
MRRLLLVVFVCSSALAQPVMFRGNAAHTGVLQAGGGRNLAGMQWRFATGGEVDGSAVVAEQTVYVGSGDGRLYAIDLERWGAGLALFSKVVAVDETEPPVPGASRNASAEAL